VSSTLDDHIRAALDRIRVSISGQLESDLSASTTDILSTVANEHRRALVEATEQTTATLRSEAEQQLAAAREDFARERDELARQREELQRSSTFEIGGLERVLGDVRDELEVARRGLEDLRSAREALENQVEEQRQEIESGRQDLEQHKRQLAETTQGLESHRQDLEQHRQDLEKRGLDLEQVNRDLERARQELELSRNVEDATKRELEESTARAANEREAGRLDLESATRETEELRNRLAQTVRLTSAFRTLDEATSLSDILDHLAQSACQESGRTAVFLVNGGKLRAWRALGFPAEQPMVGADFVPAESDVVGQAVRSGAGRQHRNGDVTHLPAFAQVDGPRDAVALPVQVGGSVIAVLYADAARADRPEDPEWLDTIDAMTKHASRVLEAMTVRQAAALWTPRGGGVVRSSRE